MEGNGKEETEEWSERCIVKFERVTFYKYTLIANVETSVLISSLLLHPLKATNWRRRK